MDGVSGDGNVFSVCRLSVAHVETVRFDILCSLNVLCHTIFFVVQE